MRDQVKDVLLETVNFYTVAGLPALVMQKVEDVTIRGCSRLRDGHVERADRKSL